MRTKPPQTQNWFEVARSLGYIYNQHHLPVYWFSQVKKTEMLPQAIALQQGWHCEFSRTLKPHQCFKKKKSLPYNPNFFPQQSKIYNNISKKPVQAYFFFQFYHWNNFIFKYFILLWKGFKVLTVHASTIWTNASVYQQK